VKLEEEAGDDTEVTATTPQCPEEVGLIFYAGSDKTAVREYDVCLDQIVDGQTIFACALTQLPAQRGSMPAVRMDWRCRPALCPRLASLH